MLHGNPRPEEKSEVSNWWEDTLKVSYFRVFRSPSGSPGKLQLIVASPARQPAVGDHLAPRVDFRPETAAVVFNRAGIATSAEATASNLEDILIDWSERESGSRMIASTSSPFRFTGHRNDRFTLRLSCQIHKAS
jgi:hypothetical protein